MTPARQAALEAVVVAAEALVSDERAWGLVEATAECIWCEANPADPVERHGKNCRFGALDYALAALQALSALPAEEAPTDAIRAGSTGIYCPCGDEIRADDARCGNCFAGHHGVGCEMPAQPSGGRGADEGGEP
jgi:hypothetical protein